MTVIHGSGRAVLLSMQTTEQNMGQALE